ncbi:MAG: HD domain-containing protein [Pyrinomonadaceae bacterium]
MSERIYRDPIHNIIRVETNSPEGKLYVDLIDTPEFQRLRRIRQLGLANFAYQGAEHSRFSHSLGVMHLSSRILERLSQKYKISTEDCVAVQAAALLHDVGHGAFSHVIEPILNFHHEDFTVEAVTSGETEISARLSNYSADLPLRISEIIRGEFRPSALGQIVSSQLDADRMDYLLRDSLMTGAKYGNFDLEWVIKSIEIDELNDRIYISAPGIYAVEEYLQARYYMFRQVYFHRTLRAVEVMLRAIFNRVLELFKSGDVWTAPGSAFEEVISGERLTLERQFRMDDSDVIFHIKQWQFSNDGTLSDLSSRFINRKIFKAIDLDMNEAQRAEYVHAARELVKGKGYNPDFYFAEDSAGDVPYNFYSQEALNHGKLIFVERGTSNKTIQEISEVSAAVRGLQKSYEIRRICFPHELLKPLKKLYREMV